MEFVFVLGPLEIDIRSWGQRDCAWLGGWNLQVPKALNRSNGASPGTLCPREHWLTFQRHLANTLGGQRIADSPQEPTHLLIQIQFVHSAHHLLPIFAFSSSPVPVHGALVWRRIQILWRCFRKHIPRSPRDLVLRSLVHSLPVAANATRRSWRTVPEQSGTLPSSNISLA